MIKKQDKINTILILITDHLKGLLNSIIEKCRIYIKYISTQKVLNLNTSIKSIYMKDSEKKKKESYQLSKKSLLLYVIVSSQPVLWP